MSLDLSIGSTPCPCCGHQTDKLSFNYTYNVSPMWYKIYPDSKHMVEIEGLTGKQACVTLCVALTELDLYPEEFIALNPENGWGSYEGFKEFISDLMKASISNPTLVWEACR